MWIELQDRIGEHGITRIRVADIITVNRKDYGCEVSLRGASPWKVPVSFDRFIGACDRSEKEHTVRVYIDSKLADLIEGEALKVKQQAYAAADDEPDPEVLVLHPDGRMEEMPLDEALRTQSRIIEEYKKPKESVLVPLLDEDEMIERAGGVRVSDEYRELLSKENWSKTKNEVAAELEAEEEREERERRQTFIDAQTTLTGIFRNIRDDSAETELRLARVAHEMKKLEDDEKARKNENKYKSSDPNNIDPFSISEEERSAAESEAIDTIVAELNKGTIDPNQAQGLLATLLKFGRGKIG